MHMSGLLVGLLAMTALCGAAPEAKPTNFWRAQASADLEAAAAGLKATYIYAVYPDPAAFQTRFDAALATTRGEVALVKDFGGYRAVLQHFAASFHDAHLVFVPSIALTDVRWPGFLLQFQNGAYRVAASEQEEIANGAVVTMCDGKPITGLVSTVASVEVGRPMTLDAVKMEAALRLMVDRGNPLYPLPTRCTIDDRDVGLTWRSARESAVATTAGAVRFRRDPVATTRLVGSDGAWVRLGYFVPDTMAQADAFRAAIAAAPSLRAKRFIVLDVRGNGGGPYSWFMAYLRGLYGQPYADYFATARLRIRGVHRLTPAIVAAEAAEENTDAALGQPVDPPFDASENQDDSRNALAAGKPYYRGPPMAFARTGPVPANPVGAKVYVLTDYGCGSACIAFVDELKLFPGVEQIGLPTTVDSRSGTARPLNLPSGNGTFLVATMTRDGRVRGDNIAQQPSIRFTGDITDDAAVERWVTRNVVTLP